jgi:hypothetical protein
MLVGLWLLAAVVATTIGFVAVDLVSTDVSGGEIQGSVLVAEPDQSAAPTPSPSTTPSPGQPTPKPSASGSATSRPPAQPPAPAAVQRTRATAGGVVTARCTGGTVWLVSWSPDPGWVVHGVQRGPADEAEVEFESASGRVKVKVQCAGGIPAFVVENRDDGNDGSGGSGHGSSDGAGGSSSDS